MIWKLKRGGNSRMSSLSLENFIIWHWQTHTYSAGGFPWLTASAPCSPIPLLLPRTHRITITNFCLGKHLVSEDDLLKDQRGSPAYISPDVLSGRHRLLRAGTSQPCTTHLSLTGALNPAARAVDPRHSLSCSCCNSSVFPAEVC